ncbi:DUF4232 domain-containing protein [Streptomyces sp. NPDC026672]|uniref:DUF4232 domain-containing protein n=1 Tax=unclassified Streptomyces TaxID=2593676 RepID=UPI0033F298C6
MSSFRTSRLRLAGAAATVALAALSLTACDNGTGVHDEGASAPASATTAAPRPASPAGTESATGADSSTPATGAEPATAVSRRPAPHASATSAPKKPAPAGGPVTCEGSTTRTVAAPLTRPLNHMLLTVTNTGTRTCYLYGYPAVRFGEAQAVPPVIADSKPQAVVTLQPGESGYASVSLSAADGSGTNARTEKSLTVYFQGRSGTGSVGTAARPALPAKGVYIDDSLKVTYWQQSMDDAITW